MAVTTANKVADYFLCFCREHGDYLTNLKLQKLVYYAQAWHLALSGKPLFDDEIQAWIHGPVIPTVYQRFKKCGYDPIGIQVEAPDFDVKIKKYLAKIFDVFGKFTAWDLQQMTHQELPWRNARKGLAPDEPSSNAISLDDMMSFYRKLKKGNERK